MEAHGGLHGGRWRPPWRSVEAPWRSVETSMMVRGGLHGGSWRSPWRLMELHGGSIHGAPWRPPRTSMELHGDLHGGLHGASMELHEPPWTSMDLHGPPWTSMSLHEVPDNVGGPKQRGGHQPHQPKPGGQQQQRGGGKMWCSCHKTTTHSDADCCTRPADRPNGNAHFAQVRPPSVPGICISWDFPVRDDSDEKPCISFLARGPACG